VCVHQALWRGRRARRWVHDQRVLPPILALGLLRARQLKESR
jgi:hypothetical protein